MGKRYSCRIVRPVLQSVIIEVEAETSQHAVNKAISEVSNCDNSAWKNVPFDHESYEPHVQEILDHDIIESKCTGPDTQTDALRSSHANTDVRYLLLAARTDMRDACALLQPWFKKLDPILQADFCEEWGKTINYICENDGLDRADGKGLQSTALHYDNVIPFDHTSLKNINSQIKRS
ncbi:MAG: hypothetical protein AAF228_10710 [Pseudomonadota bacterium]